MRSMKRFYGRTTCAGLLPTVSGLCGSKLEREEASGSVSWDFERTDQSQLKSEKVAVVRVLQARCQVEVGLLRSPCQGRGLHERECEQG